MYKSMLILLLTTLTYANEPLTLSTPKTNPLKDEAITLTLKPLHVKSLHVSIPQTQPLKHKPLKTTLIATLQDGSTKQIDDDITWITTPPRKIVPTSKSTITPNDDITITIRAKYKDILSNKLTLHVKWIVDGHTLPPKPDPKINNSTLLGIDSNNNGVRDDVERKIYQTYKRPIERAYMMQFGTRFPKVLISPRKAAHSEAIEKEMWRQYSCKGYLFMKLDIEMPDDSVDFMESAYFNTKERIRAYLEFNDEMSGGVYNIPFHDRDYDEKNCDFNITKLLELEK